MSNIHENNADEQKFLIKGKCWIIRDENNQLINHIDTDMIFHNAHLHITELSEMAQHTFGNLPNWQDFPNKVSKGDILVVGENFGSGSSRQQAVDCFRALGMTAVIGVSFGAIYKRNAINCGWPLLECKALTKNDIIKSGDVIEIDLRYSRITNLSSKKDLPDVKAFSKVQMDIFKAEGLFAVEPR